MGCNMKELLKPDFETVFEVYYDRVYKYAYTILLNRENAEDVVEETFLAAYVAYPGYDPARSSLATWLTRIAHHQAGHLVRSARYRRETALPEDFADQSPAEQDDERICLSGSSGRHTAGLRIPERTIRHDEQGYQRCQCTAYASGR